MSSTEAGLPGAICERLAMGIRRLVAHGYSSNMILMFDEAWMVGDLLTCLVGGASGNAPIGDWFIFNVDKDSCYIPGPPHRDRPSADETSFRYPPHESYTSALTDQLTHSIAQPALSLGAPKYCSVWLALTDATPENSCLYVIPREYDSGYSLLGEHISIQTGSLQHIVAQPLTQGSFLAFSHRLVHWGSLPQPHHAQRGRIALTLAFADPSFEFSYFDHNIFGPLPPLQLRLGLVAGQQIQYEHLMPLGIHMLSLYRRIFHQCKMYFSPVYYEKISVAAQFLAYVLSQKSRTK